MHPTFLGTELTAPGRLPGSLKQVSATPCRTESSPTCAMEFTGDDVFIVFNGVRIAKRGYPDTPQAKTWVSLEPGWRVLDGEDSIAIEQHGVRVH
jgi:hypothetical protein